LPVRAELGLIEKFVVLKVSIITVSYNSGKTIKTAIESVLSQDYPRVEYIIVDGMSTDNTVDIIKQYSTKISTWVSEPDNGIYDAMNKAIQLATGDVVGILNSDDFYHDSKIISTVMEVFKNQPIDAVFGDLVFVDSSNLSQVVRKYSSKSWTPEKFAYGFMPAHPTFFVKRNFYQEIGLFKTEYPIGADYELLIRFLYKNRIKYHYINKVLVKMRTGGLSTKGLKSNLILNRDILKACRENGIETNYLKIYSKYFFKVFELINPSAN
jgi:glycosyltransferase involved in cell wall biosynthesis